MKRIAYLALLVGFLFILNSCITEPEYPLPEPWLCSINADGTGFRKIKKVDLNFGTTGFWDIYMTKDNRIIFYGEKLWISDTDTIRVEQITPDNLTLTHLPPRLSQSPDGSKLFFAADKNIYQLSYPDYQLTQLTNQTTRWLRNPIVSDLGNYITYTSNGFGNPAKETEYLYLLLLQSGASDIIPAEESLIPNGLFQEKTGYVIYEGEGLKIMKRDGSDVSLLQYGGGSGFANQIFSLTDDGQFLVRDGAYNASDKSININNLITGSINEIPTAKGPSVYAIGKPCNTINRVFYVSPNNNLSQYNLDTEESIVLNPNSIEIVRFYMLAPTWDGSKVYFYADVAEK